MAEGLHDVVIVGAGPVGLALAAGLGQAGLRVALVDRSAVAIDIDAPASAWDARVYAVSPGSAAFLHGLGAWPRLDSSRITAIETMEIAGDAGGQLRFSAYEQGVRALAWIVEASGLTRALCELVRTQPLVETLSPVEPVRVSWDAQRVELTLGDARVIAGRLLVAADGAHSWTRRQAGLLQEPVSLGDTAVVANFDTALPHRGRAFQWFLGDEGVLAWLPLRGLRMSMVWSAPRSVADELMGCDPTALAQRVGAAGANALGSLSVLTPAQRFPLTSLHLSTVIGHRLALVGDAAHGVHPLAGQGMNLGLGDAAALVRVLAEGRLTRDAGAPLLLERYASRRAEPVLAMQAVTGGLARLFAARGPFARGMRNAGMNVLAAVPPLRRALAQPALR